MEYKKGYRFGTNTSYLFESKIKKLLSDKKVLDLGCGEGESDCQGIEYFQADIAIGYNYDQNKSETT